MLRAQLAATEPIEYEDLDVLLWPEGSVDADPTANASVARTLDALSARIDAPLLISAVTQRGEQYFNSSLVWQAGADNPTQTYDKRHPVPFGEYMPARSFFRLFSDQVDLLRRDFVAGDEPGGAGEGGQGGQGAPGGATAPPRTRSPGVISP